MLSQDFTMLMNCVSAADLALRKENYSLENVQVLKGVA